MQLITNTITGIDGTEAKFHAYLADNTPQIDLNRVRPAVLILPGGGFSKTSDRESEPIAIRMLSFGYQAFVLRYSVAPSRYPVSLLETADAVKLIREHAKEWHVDSDKLIVIGFSAGGHLAGQLTTKAGRKLLARHGYDLDQILPNGLALSYPVITSGEHAHRKSFDELLGPDGRGDADLLHEVSLEYQVTPETPRTFLWTTVTDNNVPVQNSLLFVNALLDAGVNVEAHFFPHGVHGSSLGTEETKFADGRGIEESLQIWPDLFHAWVEREFNH